MVVSCKRDEALDIRNTEYISFKINDDALAATGVLTKGSCDTLSYEITDWDYTGEESDTDVQTKGTLTETLSGELGLFMLQVPGKTSGVDTLTKNQSLSVSGSSVTSSSPLLWKDRTVGSKLISFAYAPYSDTVKVRNKGDKPYIMYTVPDTVTKQKDILYAVDTTQVPSSSSARKPIELKFRHALTAVQFKMNFDTLNIKSIKLVGVANIGKLFAGNVEVSGNEDFEISLDPGKKYKKDSLLNAKENTFIMLPQAFSSSSTAKIVITFNDNSTLSAPLNDQVWPAGKKVIYTLKKSTTEVEYIYFDFTAGNIVLTNSTYKGYVFVNGTATEVSGTHNNSLKYYIYQSAPDTTAAAKSNAKIKSSYAGYTSVSDIGTKNPTLPKYSTIEVNGKSWGEYITNNTDPLTVVKKWNSFTENFLEPGSPHRILIWGDAAFDITLDRVYSRYYPYVRLMNGDTYTDAENYVYNGIKVTAQENDMYGGITIGMYEFGHECQTKQNECWGKKVSGTDTRFKDIRTYKERVTLRLKGNNYFSRIDYSKPVSNTDNGYLKITSADGDGIANGTLTVTLPEDMGAGRKRRSPGALLGGGSPPSDNNLQREVSKIYFNGGIVYVGVEAYNNSNWDNSKYNVCPIGGNNGDAEITINGGVLTSVVYGPGPAIGGGAGWNYSAGKGNVIIAGGTTYAHCFGVRNSSNGRLILGTAIGGGSTGGAGTETATGAEGNVTITGGTVHAYSVGGVAMGGGTSGSNAGGKSTIVISGGRVYAQSIDGTVGSSTVKAGVSIGGGRAGTTRGNGGEATVKISGSAFIQAGSIGGGKCDNTSGKIGQANVTISGGEVSGQFLLVAGSSGTNSFTMTGGTINNSKTSDTEYKKMQLDGGAVCMESGTCTISGGAVNKCSATRGGAVYMKGGTFNMTGGTISSCSASTHGGAVYIDGGDATVSGGEIKSNLASAGNGGGVYVSAGNFTMPDGSSGKINNNSADAYENQHGNGGGIYVHSTTKNVNVNIIGGEVQYNAADRNGGGLCVDMPNTGVNATITIGKSSGTATSPYIASNSAALSGGGMAVQGSGSNIIIKSGTVKGNVSAYVQNEDIRNDGGMVDLQGKGAEVDVNYKTITFYANNGYDPEPYDEQRVITSTNSPLTPTATALAFEKEFYKKVSWNTKRDGSGVTYNLNGTGEVMNITSDLSLYAQWVENK